LNSKNVKSRGKRVLNIGKLKGMSGAGAFVLRNDRPRLAGIMIEYHADRAQIVCTKSEVALYLAMLTEADGAPFVSARAT
jgi:hypothetical protein